MVFGVFEKAHYFLIHKLMGSCKPLRILWVGLFAICLFMEEVKISQNEERAN